MADLVVHSSGAFLYRDSTRRVVRLNWFDLLGSPSAGQCFGSRIWYDARLDIPRLGRCWRIEMRTTSRHGRTRWLRSRRGQTVLSVRVSALGRRPGTSLTLPPPTNFLIFQSVTTGPCDPYGQPHRFTKVRRPFRVIRVSGRDSTLPLLIVKRRVKKMIEDEDQSNPLTDEQITTRLEGEGIQNARYCP
jgi:hypothetical protein